MTIEIDVESVPTPFGVYITPHAARNAPYITLTSSLSVLEKHDCIMGDVFYLCYDRMNQKFKLLLKHTKEERLISVCDVEYLFEADRIVSLAVSVWNKSLIKHSSFPDNRVLKEFLCDLSRTLTRSRTFSPPVRVTHFPNQYTNQVRVTDQVRFTINTNIN